MTEIKTVAVFAPMFPPAFLGGGPIRTLDALVGEAPGDWKVHVLTSDRDLGGGSRLPVSSNGWVATGTTSVYYMTADRLGRILRGFLALRRAKPDVLYFNSFFDPLFSIVPQLFSGVFFIGRPMKLLAPRGEFSAGALAMRYRKKRLFIGLFKAFGLHHDVVWHASTEHEAVDIRSIWGVDAVVLVREDETRLPVHAAAPLASESRQLSAIFLGRIVPNKGLLILLEALQSVTAPIQLDIFGSEEDARYAESCHRAAATAAPNVSVNFMGSVPPQDVRGHFNSYDIFLMPTAGENFGHVIAEALSASCPVMCTDRTPWTALLHAGAGEVVRSSTPEGWREAIDSYSALTLSDRLDRRLAAGRLYEQWRSTPKGPHIFSMIRELNPLRVPR